MRFFIFLLLVSFALVGDLARGQGWVQENSGTTQQLADVSFPCQDTAYVFAGGGVGVLRSINGGVTWAQVTSPEAGFFKFFDRRNGYLASYAGNSAYRTSDGGQTWTTSNDSNQLCTIVVPLSRDTAFIIGDNISKTTDGGKSWHLTPKRPDYDRFNDAVFFDSRHGICVGNMQPGPPPMHLELTAGCFTTSNGGETWEQQYTGAISDLQGVSYANSTKIVAVELLSKICRSVDGGRDWVLVDTLRTGAHLYGIAMHNAIGYVVGAQGTILHTLDTGATWFAEESGTSTDLSGISALGDSLALAAGNNGVILKTINGGTDWVQLTPPSPIPLQTLVFPQPETASQEIEYSLPQLQHVTVRVYDLTGHVIQTLLDKELQPAGEHRLTFRGDGLPAGTYIYHIDTERYHASGKSMLVK